ncbi:catalase-like domain-containing protein [Daldinia caldariorum]|uniref:catalase-like domain-containing protein n=1 Tax=Daldinia caldariorum TaxID=326644 RepID=UPI0020072C88|nr:catalase-like domain-containing protein [Daldinia caldariorum]KAI1466928.1 catalase-like domain-containing protein [Daldinia caldariorum]
MSVQVKLVLLTKAAEAPIYTTSNGSPAVRPDGSQRDGKNLLLNGFHLIDLLSHFNREKIPERVTHDISDTYNIDILLGFGKKTPCITRFSTTGLERGSAELVRDPKGMAAKFFTEQGNWDWVCLNIPMFFIRDPAKFPGMMHAQRRDPRTNLANPDLCEFGTMFNYRSMSGYVGHAYKWVMPDGSRKYVHFFLSSDRGPNFTEGGKIQNVSPTDPDSATRDFFEAIEQGDYPTWTANVQVVDSKDVHKLGFDILDLTKHWNLGNYPPD